MSDVTRRGGFWGLPPSARVHLSVSLYGSCYYVSACPPPLLFGLLGLLSVPRLVGVRHRIDPLRFTRLPIEGHADVIA